MKLLVGLLSLLLFSTEGKSKVEKHIQKALDASVKIIIPKQGSGSGFAFHRDKKRKRTLIATNDHVCQLTRGRVFLTGGVNYRAKIGTKPVRVLTVKNKVYPAKVVYTSNMVDSNEKDKRADLCILEIKEKLPTVKLAKGAKVGEKIFTVGAPKGWFPLVHEGRAGPAYRALDILSYQVYTVLLNRGSSGGGAFNYKGEVVGVVFAISLIEEELPVPMLTYGVPVKHLKKFVKQYYKSLKN